MLNESLDNASSRLRNINISDIMEDVHLLLRGVLDFRSFVMGYMKFNHPVEVKITSSSGEIKSLRRTHNLRTNKGGIDQANNMSGSTVGPAIYIGLSNNLSTSITSTLTSLPGEITTNGLSRTASTFSITNAPVANQTTTVGAAYTLTASWTVSGSSVSNIQACAVFTGPTTASPGDMWFISSFTPESANPGDTITLNYVINY